MLCAPFKMPCCLCAIEIAGNPVLCSGHCKGSFHPKCAGLSTAVIKELAKDAGLFWVCQACLPMFKDRMTQQDVPASKRFEMVEAAINQLTLSVSDVQKSVNSLTSKDVITAAASHLTARVPTHTGSSTENTSHISLPPTQGSQGTSRRPTHINIIDPAAQVSSPPPFRRGTGAPEAHDPKCIPLDSQMFWLFITRLRPNVTEENILTMACRRLSLNMADIIVRKLVKRDTNCSTLSFVSFKVGLPASVQHVALSPTTWPPGLIFREFIDNRTRHERALTPVGTPVDDLTLTTPPADLLTALPPTPASPRKRTRNDCRMADSPVSPSSAGA